MDIKVITDGGDQLVQSISRFIKYVLPDFLAQVGPDLVLLDKGLVENSIEKIGKLISDDKVVVVFSDPGPLKKESEIYSWLVKQSRVGQIKILELKSLPSVYEGLKSQSKGSEISFRYTKILDRERKIRSLLHGMDHKLSNPMFKQDWFIEANNLGFFGDDDQIINLVKSWKPETTGEFQGVYLEGVYVDAYQTLFNNDWILVRETVERVIELANNRPIYVISDSDQRELRELLDKNNINWLLISKFVLRGAILETVVDNLPAEDFLKVYSINYKNYINVKDLI